MKKAVTFNVRSLSLMHDEFLRMQAVTKRRAFMLQQWEICDDTEAFGEFISVPKANYPVNGNLALEPCYEYVSRPKLELSVVKQPMKKKATAAKAVLGIIRDLAISGLPTYIVAKFMGFLVEITRATSPEITGDMMNNLLYNWTPGMLRLYAGVFAFTFLSARFLNFLNKERD